MKQKNLKLGAVLFICLSMVFVAACKKKDKPEKECTVHTQDQRMCSDNTAAVWDEKECKWVCPEDSTATGTVTYTGTNTNTSTVTYTATNTATSTVTYTATP
ncbi:MAG: hypothetical protein M9962_06725 [Oligoflexia bacterium]|nr:hypothetical protein [Oligoflexia bacterium]